MTRVLDSLAAKDRPSATVSELLPEPAAGLVTLNTRAVPRLEICSSVRMWCTAWAARSEASGSAKFSGRVGRMPSIRVSRRPIRMSPA